MNKMSWSFMLIISLAHLSAQKFELSFQLDGETREFIVERPNGQAPSGGYPLVFMLHGTSGDGEKFYNISGWKEVGEQEGFITVFPSSLRYCIQDSTGKRNFTTKWNNGDLIKNACPNQDLKDDVRFFRKMVDTIVQTFRINKDMIFVAGFSNGGVMAAKLALEMPTIFSAATCTSAFLDDLDSMRVKNKIPVWNMFGTHDSMFIERSGKPYIPFNDTCLEYLRNGIHNYLGSFGLDSLYIKSQDSIILNYEYTKPQQGETKAFFRHSLILGMTHQYPNGFNFPGMKAAPLQWEFFKSVNITSNTRQLNTNKLFIYPNPFLHSFTLSYAHEDDEYTLTDLWGKKYSVINEGQNFNLETIPPQLYILTIKHRNNTFDIIKCLKIN